MSRRHYRQMLSFGLVATWVVGFGHSVALAQLPCSETKLLATDGNEQDRFGIYTALSGELLIVGADKDDDNGENSGSAYVYRFNGTEWIEEGHLVPSDGIGADYCCSAVDIDGDVAIVGSYRHDDNGEDSGSAYVFRFNGSEWIEEAELLASDGEAGDFFGSAVGISGDVALVTARHDADDGGLAGSAYIYRFNGSEWSEEIKLLASDGAEGDRFGIDAALDHDVVIVGSWKHDDNGYDSGAAYIFRFDGKGWTEEAKLLASDGMGYEFFGGSVAIHGDLAIAGAYADYDQGDKIGSAYIYRFNGTEWAEEVKLAPIDQVTNDDFGRSVGIGVDTAIVGARNQYLTGSAYVYRFDGTDWIEDGKLLASDGQVNDQFGISVSVEGDRFVIGASGVNDLGLNSGSSYVFECVETDCAGDANGDGQVDPLDSGFVLARFGCPVGTGDPNCDAADQNGDGLVDPLDSGFVLARFGECQ